MRILLSFLFICIWQVSFSQMTFAEMKNIQKMDLNKFETYCLSNGYEFNNVIDDNNYFGMCYAKVSGLVTKHLSLYDKYEIVYKNVVDYQTGSSSEYLTIKTQLESAGLKLTKTSSYDGVLFREYSSDLLLVNIASGKHPESEKEFYQIILKKKN